MSRTRRTKTLLSAALALAATCSHAAIVITNGDFETGDLTGWNPGATGATIVSGASALAGNHSLALPGGAGGGQITQTFASPTKGLFTVSFLFEHDDPGGAGDRALNFTLEESTVGGAGRINGRVVDLDDDGDGDLQIYNNLASAGSTGWQTVLTDAINFNSVNQFYWEIDAYGANNSYSISINGSSASNLQYAQNSTIEGLQTIVFANDFGTTGFTVDNVHIYGIPEPSTGLLMALGAMLILFRRRTRTLSTR